MNNDCNSALAVAREEKIHHTFIERAFRLRNGGRRGGSYRDRTWVAIDIERIPQRLRFVLERIPWPERFQAKTGVGYVV
jgi:hypothetical protein